MAEKVANETLFGFKVEFIEKYLRFTSNTSFYFQTSYLLLILRKMLTKLKLLKRMFKITLQVVTWVNAIETIDFTARMAKAPKLIFNVHCGKNTLTGSHHFPTLHAQNVKGDSNNKNVHISVTKKTADWGILRNSIMKDKIF